MPPSSPDAKTPHTTVEVFWTRQVFLTCCERFKFYHLHNTGGVDLSAKASWSAIRVRNAMLSIRIPGTFVVLQGVPGDGVRNTIDSLPTLDDDTDDELDDTFTCHTNNEGSSRGTLISPSVDTTGVMPAAEAPLMVDTLHYETTACTRSVPVSPSLASSCGSSMADQEQSEHYPLETSPSTETDQACELLPRSISTDLTLDQEEQGENDQHEIAITDEPSSIIQNEPIPPTDAPRTNSSTTVASEQQQDLLGLSQRQRRALDGWTRECRETERAHHSEWNEAAALERQGPHSSRAVASANFGSGTTSNTSATPTTPWWLTDDGCLSLMEQLPLPIFGTSCGFPGRCIGQLVPGTVVVATELVTVCSADLVTCIDVTPFLPDDCAMDGDEMEADDDITNDDAKRTSMCFPPGRQGWVQLLKVESPVSGYCVLSVDGYSFLGPGLPSVYCNSDRWLWRVTCIEGAFVRSGLDLSSEQLACLPYGSLVRVKRKTINAMALSRLQIEAILYDELTGSPSFVSGWISEFFNPLSGQRGSIVHPVPFPVPAVYKVTFSQGAVIRSDVDLSSPVIGHAPLGALVLITGRMYSERPTHKCIARYRLAGNGGWISARLNMNPPHDEVVVKFDGILSTFEPDKAGQFHLSAMQRILSPSTGSPSQTASPPMSFSPSRDASATHTESEGIARPHLSANDEGLASSTSPPSVSEPPSPSCVYSAPIVPSKQRRKDPNDSNCSICLCEDRTATIVHGETGHIVCCLVCARILKARGDPCPVCRLPIDLVVQHFWA